MARPRHLMRRTYALTSIRSITGRSRDDHQTTESRARPRRSWLARHETHLLVRPVLRPALHGFPGPPRHQRGPSAAVTRLRQSFARQHGNHLVRARGHARRSEEHTSELQSHSDIVCPLLFEKKNLSSNTQELTRP